MTIADPSNTPLADLLSLKGKTAVVTGGAQGLGKGIVRRLAEAGACVVIGDLKEDLAAEAAKEFSDAYGGKVLAARLDVTDTASVEAVADFAVKEGGSLDVWVSNAGIYPNVTLLEMDDATWDRVMDINLRGAMAGARAAARRMIDAGTGGVIVNIASTAGFKGVAPGVAAYVTSKHGVVGMTKQLALELAPNDIRVLGVAPTFCDTEGNWEALEKMSGGNRDIAKEIEAIATSRLGRIGTRDDIARIVLFCASDMAAFMTGSTLMGDAGEAV